MHHHANQHFILDQQQPAALHPRVARPHPIRSAGALAVHLWFYPLAERGRHGEIEAIDPPIEHRRSAELLLDARGDDFGAIARRNGSPDDWPATLVPMQAELAT